MAISCLDPKHRQSDNRMSNKSQNYKIYKNNVRTHIMYAHVTVKHTDTTGNKQHMNRKDWVFKYFLRVFNIELSIIRLMNLYSKPLKCFTASTAQLALS